MSVIKLKGLGGATIRLIYANAIPSKEKSERDQIKSHLGAFSSAFEKQVLLAKRGCLRT